jgi:hypothetical protein
MDRVQKFIDTSFELLSISLFEDLSLLTDEMKSSLKGKVLGTRLQARTFLIHKDQEQLALARRDSDAALGEFSAQGDLNRQYQYRSQIESEANEPIEALKWLGKAFQIDYEDLDDTKDLLQSIFSARNNDRLFGAMHFSRILVTAYRNNHQELAEQMYQQWVKSGIEKELFKDVVNEHPYEIILWKHAYYLASTNRVKASIEKYNQALEICNCLSDRYTLRSIGLGITFEKASVLIEAGKNYNQEAKKTVQLAKKLYNEFMKEELPNQMRAYFEPLEEELDTLDKLSKQEQSNLLVKLSQQIRY